MQHCITPVTASAPPPENTGKFILSASWTTSLSVGGKRLAVPVSQRNTHTHTCGQKDTVRGALERRRGQFPKENSRGATGTARLCKVESDALSPGSNVCVCSVGPGAPFPLVSRTGDAITTVTSQRSTGRWSQKEERPLKLVWKMGSLDKPTPQPPPDSCRAEYLERPGGRRLRNSLCVQQAGGRQSFDGEKNE